jgi:hypothetical protein
MLSVARLVMVRGLTLVLDRSVHTEYHGMHHACFTEAAMLMREVYEYSCAFAQVQVAIALNTI